MNDTIRAHGHTNTATDSVAFGPTVHTVHTVHANAHPREIPTIEAVKVNEPAEKPHTIDPATGIWPIAEWGARCGRGFRTNRQAARLKRP